jgi:hypothetical protein
MKALLITISVVLAAAFAFWREGIAELDDVGHFEWAVFTRAFLCGLVMVWIYLLPALLAEQRRHRNLVAILLLNLFLGWTFLGWVGALIWSIYRERS